jgi:hypothetical protein
MFISVKKGGAGKQFKKSQFMPSANRRISISYTGIQYKYFKDAVVNIAGVNILWDAEINSISMTVLRVKPKSLSAPSLSYS